jgi:hypothetical protein
MSTPLTISALIEKLRALPPDARVYLPCDPCVPFFDAGGDGGAVFAAEDAVPVQFGDGRGVAIVTTQGRVERGMRPDLEPECPSCAAIRQNFGVPRAPIGKHQSYCPETNGRPELIWDGP